MMSQIAMGTSVGFPRALTMQASDSDRYRF